MRKLLVPVCLIAAGCGQESAQPANGSGDGIVTAPARGPVQTATLTGLYEGAGTPPSQLCISEQRQVARFGLVTRRDGRPGCSGAGTATRAGPILRLVMNGESACAIEARLDSGRVTFPARLPRGCSYYCAPGADAGGVVFVKTGGSREDALRARDIVGDPLCT
jgi:hypothetical protein